MGLCPEMSFALLHRPPRPGFAFARFRIRSRRRASTGRHRCRNRSDRFIIAAEYLDAPEAHAEYLRESFAAGDPGETRESLAIVARAHARHALPALRTATEYEQATAIISHLLDIVGEDEAHPLAEALDLIADQVKAWEEVHVQIPEHQNER